MGFSSKASNRGEEIQHRSIPSPKSVSSLTIDPGGRLCYVYHEFSFPGFYLHMVPMISLRLDYKKVHRDLVRFIRGEVHKAGFERAVLGLSGGVDSSLSAFLSAGALGNGNVYGINMPYRESSTLGVQHAQQVAKQLNIQFLSIEITPMIDMYVQSFPDADPVRKGNKMARERMSILYDQSARFSALVVGSSNKTEILLGYGTIYGDMACAINPLGDLYKTQVWDLAREVGVPEEIIEKAPTADLWRGQTDEAELGLSYHEVDRLLNLMIDNGLGLEDLVSEGFTEDFIRKVAIRIRSSEFKRRMPVVGKIPQQGKGGSFRGR
jgi:NAD+ synthase